MSGSANPWPVILAVPTPRQEAGPLHTEAEAAKETHEKALALRVLVALTGHGFRI